MNRELLLLMVWESLVGRINPKKERGKFAVSAHIKEGKGFLSMRSKEELRARSTPLVVEKRR